MTAALSALSEGVSQPAVARAPVMRDPTTVLSLPPAEDTLPALLCMSSFSSSADLAMCLYSAGSGLYRSSRPLMIFFIETLMTLTSTGHPFVFCINHLKGRIRADSSDGHFIFRVQLLSCSGKGDKPRGNSRARHLRCFLSVPPRYAQYLVASST